MEKWLQLAKFILEWQYGFLKKIGTLDYGAALSLTIQDCLERFRKGQKERKGKESKGLEKERKV